MAKSTLFRGSRKTGIDDTLVWACGNCERLWPVHTHTCPTCSCSYIPPTKEPTMNQPDLALQLCLISWKNMLAFTQDPLVTKELLAKIAQNNISALEEMLEKK